MIWCKYMTLACKTIPQRGKKKKIEKLTSSRWIIYMILICIIPQFSSTEMSGSTDPAVFCLCMYTLATLALVWFWPCASAYYIWWVTIVSEYLMKPRQALPLFFRARSQWKTLSLSRPSVGISEGALKSQAALALLQHCCSLCTAASRAQWQPGQSPIAGDKSGTIHPAQWC